MEGLLVLIALIPVVLLILAISNATRLGSISRDVTRLRKEVQHIRNARPVSIAPEVKPAAKPVPKTAPVAPAEKVKPTPVAQTAPKPAPKPPVRKVIPAPKPQARPVPPSKPKLVEPKREGWIDRWFKNKPDLEKFIGENLMNKVGIAVFVIGIGLFLKLAIDRGYVNDTGKVIVGLLTGGILIFFAHRLREIYRAFSSVLIGGGITIFYFTFWFAYEDYGLIGQTPTFIIMIGVTALAVAFSLLYDRKELAILSLLGGFATPFLASSGSGNYLVLFTYLCILNVGMLVLAERKKWQAINILSLLLTWGIFGIWVLDAYDGFAMPPMHTAIIFASAFFLIFFAMNMRYSLRHKTALSYSQHGLLLVNTGGFYTLGLTILAYSDIKLSGLLTACLGLFYLVNVYIFKRAASIDRSAFYLLIGLVLTFISLVAPIQLEGSYITLFWAAEGVLLMWLAEKSGLSLLWRSALVIGVLMLISWCMDLTQIYNEYADPELNPLLNSGTLTSLCVLLALIGLSYFARKEASDRGLIGSFKIAELKVLLTVLSVLVLFVGGLVELAYQVSGFFENPSNAMAIASYSLLFILAIEYKTRQQDIALRTGFFMVLGFGLIYAISAGYRHARNALDLWVRGSSEAPMFFHILFVVVLIAVIYRVTQLARELLPREHSSWRAYLWCMCGFFVILASQQLDLAMITGFGVGEWGIGDTLHDLRKVGYPILWAIGSFLFMFYGMRVKLKTVRLIALALFGITLAKLFLFDISGASETGRVVAFILLGVLLLIVSFMYQKLKHLLIEGETTKIEK